MRIVYFRVENFRNLRLAECSEVPDFMVICGGNGCGKSALLEALMTAMEHTGAYGNFTFDPRAVSADSARGGVTLRLRFAHQIPGSAPPGDKRRGRLEAGCLKSAAFLAS